MSDHRHIATIQVYVVDGQFALSVETSRCVHALERTDTLCTSFALATEPILREAELLRLRNRSADLEALTESALRDNRIVLGSGDIT